MATPYISWVGHGAGSLAPPGVFTGASSHAFAFDASAAAMQALTDKLLNPAAQGKVRYHAFVDRAMVTFMDIAQCTSQTDVVGWVPGRECAVWVPLLEHRAGRLPRFVLWTPYIFISYTIGMLTGREVWGWSKVLGDIRLPADEPGAPAAFTCSTLLFETLARTTQGRFEALLRVTGPGPDPPPTPWTSATHALERIVGDLIGELGAEIVGALHVQPCIPAIAMKQMRASEDADAACYQAVVDSPARITQFRGGGLLDASFFTLSITNCESHAIAQDILGLEPSTADTLVPIRWAARMDFDFEALPGPVIAP